MGVGPVVAVMLDGVAWAQVTGIPGGPREWKVGLIAWPLSPTPVHHREDAVPGMRQPSD